MREVVRDNWQKFKNGKVDLIVAAMTTDTAIKLAQNAEAKFDLLVTRPNKYPVTETRSGLSPPFSSITTMRICTSGLSRRLRSLPLGLGLQPMPRVKHISTSGRSSLA